MAAVKVSQFGGIAPRRHPTQLADGMAETAHNCRLKTGKLVPLRQPRLVAGAGAGVLLEGGLSDVADARSLHVWRRQDGSFDFLLFPGVTWAVPGNVADDDLTRLVVSGDRDGDGKAEGAVVYMRGGAAGLKRTVPLAKPALRAPHVQRNSGQGELTDNVRYTRFFVSWVDEYGMESPFSEPSLVSAKGEWVAGDLEYLDGDAVTVSNFGSQGDFPTARKIRVYKVVTGMETGRCQFIAEADATLASTWADGIGVKVKDEDAGEIMPDIGEPPADLSCILDVPGAFYCGFSPSKPKTVCFSDIDLFYSWPVAYRYDIRDNIVALAVTANSVFALTDGWPYVLSGTAPESMTVSKLAGPAACVSPTGVCVYRNAVYYVSNAGLMAIANSADAGTVCQNLTNSVFTKDQWLAYNPSSCVMGQHDGALFLFFTLADGTHRGLTIDLVENASIAVTTHDEAAKCLCVDDREDRMYYVREGA